jgi:acetyltransferase-like isoleucine patch superfamily enzyme
MPGRSGRRFLTRDAIHRFIAQRILQINGHVPWPVHFTSRVVNPERVRLGRNAFPGDSPGCYIQAYNGIEIGDNTNLGPGVGLISANHDPDDNTRHVKSPPIKIGADCWIGMNAVVLPGVTLGDGVIVGAGSVVTRSYPSRVVIAGNPARVLRHLDDDPDRESQTVS